MRYVGVAAAIITAAALAFATGGEADEVEDLKRRLAIVEDRLERLESYRAVDKYVCTDEYEQAVAYATTDVKPAAVPDLWDGTPFIVDISSTFPNAYALLDVVADEADRIREFLGYEIFVAGAVLPLPDIEKSALRAPSRHNLIPPAQHIEIRCCYGEDISSAGTAFPWLRMILLENDGFQSRHIIIHEVYHLLGFSHPGETLGVEMSDSLMRGPGLTPFGAAIPTQPTPLDLAQLSCIYSATEDTLQLTSQATPISQATPTLGANEAPCEINGTGEVTLYTTASTGGNMSVYIDGRLVGSLWSSYLFGGPDCGAPSDTIDGRWVTETLTAGHHTVSATVSDGTTWEGEVDVRVCRCAGVGFN